MYQKNSMHVSKGRFTSAKEPHKCTKKVFCRYLHYISTHQQKIHTCPQKSHIHPQKSHKKSPTRPPKTATQFQNKRVCFMSIESERDLYTCQNSPLAYIILMYISKLKEPYTYTLLKEPYISAKETYGSRARIDLHSLLFLMQHTAKHSNKKIKTLQYTALQCSTPGRAWLCFFPQSCCNTLKKKKKRCNTNMNTLQHSATRE